MTIRTSLWGRRLGIDEGDRLESPKGFRTNNLVAGSTGTTITNDGITTLASTAGNNTTFNIAAPVVGVEKTIVSIGASTSQIVSSTGAGATFTSTATGVSNKATFVGLGQALHLVGLSTSSYGVRGNVGGVAFSS